MNTRNTQHLASEILQLAADIEFGDEPSREEKVNGLFQMVQNQMGTLIEELKREHDAATSKIHVQRLNQVLDDLEMVWRDLKPALDEHEVMASDKTAGRFELFKKLYDAALRQVGAIENAVKRRRDLPDQKHHLDTLGKVQDDLEECWRDLGMALQSEEGLLL